MTRRIFFLDLGLVVLLSLGGIRLRQDWKTFNVTHQTSAIRPKAETLPGLPAGTAAAQTVADWTAIPSRNPFSFDRTDITIPAPPEPAAPPKPMGPKPVLFGTMNIGSDRVAMLAPAQAAGSRNSRPMKVGEAMDGWTVVQIEDTAVVVEGNAVRETLLINDPTAQVQRDHTRTVAASQPASVQSVQTVKQPTPQPTTPSTPTAAPSAAPAPFPFGGQVQPDGSIIIQTPFGPNVIRKP